MTTPRGRDKVAQNQGPGYLCGVRFFFHRTEEEVR